MLKNSCLVILLALILIGGYMNTAQSQPTTATLKAGQELDKITISALSRNPDVKFTSPAGISKSLHFVLYRNNVFIPVSVNASKPCLFWVDTGGGTSFINSRHKSFEAIKNNSSLYHVLDLDQEGKLVKNYLELYQVTSLKFAGIELYGTIMQFMGSDSFDQTIFDETGLEICGMW